MLVTSRTPKEASSRSLIAALSWLVCGLLGVLVAILSWELVVRAFYGQIASLYRGTGLIASVYRGMDPIGLVQGLYKDMGTVIALALVDGVVLGLGLGLVLALRNGGWFVLLQRVAHRSLAQAGNLPPRPYDFLEWGIEKQIFRRVGGGVRYRHNLIQQHLASTSEGVS